MAVDPSSRVPPAPAPERELTSLLGNYVVFHDCDKPPVALYVAGIDSTSNEVVLISEKAGGGGDVKRIDVQHFKQELAEQTYVVPAKARQMRVSGVLLIAAPHLCDILSATTGCMAHHGLRARRQRDR